MELHDIPACGQAATRGVAHGADPAQHGPVRTVVTTPLHPSSEDSAAAEAGAGRRGLALSPRGVRSLATVARDAGADAVLVLGARHASLWAGGREHAWHAGMAELRLRRMERGEQATRDGFLEAAALRPGDAVLDATLGLGMDALVAAGAVGPAGRVLGVEASLPLAALVAEGLARDPSPAARRVEVVRDDSARVLHRLPDRSFDVVVFDPMFRQGRAANVAFDLVRRLGSPAPLASGTLARARRVARRHVVVKDGVPGWDLARLGLAPLPCARWARRLYARAAAL